MSKYGRRAQAGGAWVRDSVHPHTLSGGGGGRRPASLSPEKIFLGSCVSTERAPQGQGQPQGAFAKSGVCLAPMEGSQFPIWETHVRLLAFRDSTLLRYPGYPNHREL